MHHRHLHSPHTDACRAQTHTCGHTYHRHTHTALMQRYLDGSTHTPQTGTETHAPQTHTQPLCRHAYRHVRMTDTQLSCRYAHTRVYTQPLCRHSHTTAHSYTHARTHTPLTQRHTHTHRALTQMHTCILQSSYLDTPHTPVHILVHLTDPPHMAPHIAHLTKYCLESCLHLRAEHTHGSHHSSRPPHIQCLNFLSTASWPR